MREVVVVDATEAPPLPMQVLCCVHGLNAHLRAHKGRKSTTTLYLVCTITYTPGGTADDPPAPQRSCAGVGISCLTALARPAPSHRTTAPPHHRTPCTLMHPHRARPLPSRRPGAWPDSEILLYILQYGRPGWRQGTGRLAPACCPILHA